MYATFSNKIYHKSLNALKIFENLVCMPFNCFSSLGHSLIEKKWRHCCEVEFSFNTCTKLLSFSKIRELEAQGPFITPDNQQQTVQSDKKDNQNDMIQINACLVGNTSVCCCEHLFWRRISSKESPSSTYCCPALDPSLRISSQNHYQNGSIPSKAFCLWSSLWLLLALPWIHPRADLIKSLNTCAGHENLIPTKFHKHPSRGSVVKADYVCSHIYIYMLLVHTPSFT